MSCAVWHASDCTHADDSMSILYPALAIIVGELCILACWLLDDVEDSLSILYPALVIIASELCLQAYWGL